jgi:hypothetical protein
MGSGLSKNNKAPPINPAVEKKERNSTLELLATADSAIVIQVGVLALLSECPFHLILCCC